MTKKRSSLRREAPWQLWSCMSCCWLLRSLQHGGLHRVRWWACLNTFSQMDTARALSSASLLMCSSACARVATGQRQPARSIHKTSISTRRRSSRTWYASYDRPPSPAPSHMHLFAATRAHSPPTRARLAGTDGTDAHGGANGAQHGRTRPPRAVACHVWTVRRRQGSPRGRRPQWGLSLRVPIPTM